MTSKKLPAIEFSERHVRISPQSLEELLHLEPSQITAIIHQVREEGELYAQLSHTWRRKVRLVDDYGPDSFIPDEVLAEWVDFLRRVLFPKEDGWQRKRDRLAQRNQDQLAVNRQRLKKSTVLTYYWRRAGLNTTEVEDLSPDQLAEALRWCEAARNILTHPNWTEYAEAEELTDESLIAYSIIGLRDFLAHLEAFANRDRLIEQIEATPNYQEFLRNHPDYSRYDGTPLSSIPNKDLRAIVRELEASAEMGLSYGPNKQIVSLPPSQ